MLVCFHLISPGNKDNYKQNMFNPPQADNIDLKIIYIVDNYFSDSMDLSLWEVTCNSINPGVCNQWKSMISSVILKSTNIQLIKLVNSDQVLIGISQSTVNQQSHRY